ncbi:hypothetical protein [Vibrio quintilis]|uniref:Uncharacterized protein n=1 Tax=Vibrio quintilis TaxID=1117707 RepID=A0A1M7YSQ8_9VIBR|nr:hypothetical protein [Vibrio quintilis]SHO55566.1 hypothetical protein VQ7734_01302 [Vibrio quintilis]
MNNAIPGLLSMLILSGMHPACAGETKVTGDAALASSASSQLSDAEGYNASSVYATLPKGSGNSGKPVIVTGSSGSSCTRVYPPAGTSVSTYDIYLVGTYIDQTNHEKSHTTGVARKITSNSGTQACAPFRQAGWYGFHWLVLAYKK